MKKIVLGIGLAVAVLLAGCQIGRTAEPTCPVQDQLTTLEEAVKGKDDVHLKVYTLEHSALLKAVLIERAGEPPFAFNQVVVSVLPINIENSTINIGYFNEGCVTNVSLQFPLNAWIEIEEQAFNKGKKNEATLTDRDV